jgi:hypothetical protein
MTWNQRKPTPNNSMARYDKGVFCLRAVGGETRIDTDFGTVPAKLLTDQHRLRVLGDGFRAIKWAERLNLDEDFLGRYPELKPLRIPAGVFRPGVPRRDVFVSRNTMICASGVLPEFNRFGAAHAFVPQSLDALGECESITYVVIGCARPTMLRAEGMWLSC